MPGVPERSGQSLPGANPAPEGGTELELGLRAWPRCRMRNRCGTGPDLFPFACFAGNSPLVLSVSPCLRGESVPAAVKNDRRWPVVPLLDVHAEVQEVRRQPEDRAEVLGDDR